MLAYFAACASRSRSLALALALAASATHDASAAILIGRVIEVVDGQTVVVRDAGKQRFTVRLLGVAASRLDDPLGAQARVELANNILDKPVEVEWSKVDQYGHLLGIVYFGRINKAMLKIKGIKRFIFMWYFLNSIY